jgi:NDP-sugar pyrophosphorylase family protein
VNTPVSAPAITMPDVAVLCGGLGTRLRPAVADRPKVLADVAGRPFLAWLLDLLDAQGFSTVVLCTGYKSTEVETEFGATHGRLRLRYSPELKPLGTGGALRNALEQLETPAVLVLNGDSYCHADLARLSQDHAASAIPVSMVLTRVDDASRYGAVERSALGRVRSFREKGDASGSAWINAGIYMVARSLIAAIPAQTACSLEHDVMPSWIAAGVRGVESAGPFIDIGTPESYVAANLLFRDLVGRGFAATVPASV